MQASHVGDVLMQLHQPAVPNFASSFKISALPCVQVIEHWFEREVPETAQRSIEQPGGVIFMKATGERAQNRHVAVERPKPLCNDSKPVIAVGHLPAKIGRA